MDKWEMYMEIQQLLKKGFSKTKVADKLGVSRATVYRHLKRSPSEMAEWVESLQTRKKKLNPYKELILNWLREHPDLSAAQVEDWLMERYKEQLEVGESTVRAYVRELRVEYKIAKESTPRDYEAIPDSPMGEQVQVDFGHTKQKTSDNKEVKLNFIAFVLSNPRYKYKEWLDRPFTTQDVIQAHENAFQWFSGIPGELVYDQDSLIVVSENGGDLILSIADRLSHQCGDLSHYLRSTEPFSAGVRATLINVANNINNHWNYTRSNGCLYYYLNILSLNS
ncbi:MAG: helix-turn-helix domain-containing protein [Bacillota bacterium]